MAEKGEGLSAPPLIVSGSTLAEVTPLGRCRVRLASLPALVRDGLFLQTGGQSTWFAIK